ncbi:hypothetical protein AXF42_Ash000843 [Apostasia shenzhenica]|uniref:Uncharacterized protein n=1 Tax=Apostasia shenzhenica TaxID=1088818 RepID=A0A2I0AT81_9ASPA|nr:hypothetical protein AXF42_Ash000843 [Apostasia shenzhenica]
MGSSSVSLLLHPLPIRRTAAAICCIAKKSSLSRPLLGRRQCLYLFLSSPAGILARGGPASAEDIPLFGLRKKLKKLEEDAVEVVTEGEKVVKEGLAAAGKEVEVVEAEGISAAAGIGAAGDLVQAGAVACAEVVGVLVGMSVVNGILGPEGK